MTVVEVENEIITLEQGDTNWQNIQKLAWLYTVHDHLTHDGMPVAARKVMNTMPEYTGEFGQAVSGASIDDLMNILSEHMSVIKVLHPKEYQAVLDKIAGIPR